MNDEFKPDSKAWVSVGKVGATHGLNGWLRFFNDAEDLETLSAAADWVFLLGNQKRVHAVEDIRFQAKHALIKLSGIDDIDAAGTLTNAITYIPRSALPELDDDAGFYWHDLEGCEVINGDTPIGKVSHLYSTGSLDVMVVKGAEEWHIPFRQSVVVKSVDISAEKIVVDWDISNA